MAELLGENSRLFAYVSAAGGGGLKRMNSLPASTYNLSINLCLFLGPLSVINVPADFLALSPIRSKAKTTILNSNYNKQVRLLKQEWMNEFCLQCIHRNPKANRTK